MKINESRKISLRGGREWWCMIGANVGVFFVKKIKQQVSTGADGWEARMHCHTELTKTINGGGLNKGTRPPFRSIDHISHVSIHIGIYADTVNSTNRLTIRCIHMNKCQIIFDFQHRVELSKMWSGVRDKVYIQIEIVTTQLLLTHTTMEKINRLGQTTFSRELINVFSQFIRDSQTNSETWRDYSLKYTYRRTWTDR